MHNSHGVVEMPSCLKRERQCACLPEIRVNTASSSSDWRRCSTPQCTHPAITTIKHERQPTKLGGKINEKRSHVPSTCTPVFPQTVVQPALLPPSTQTAMRAERERACRRVIIFPMFLTTEHFFFYGTTLITSSELCFLL